MVQYADFTTSTGYGDVAGLSGANCRHSFGPYFPGISPPPPSTEELDKTEQRELETTHYKWRDSRGREHERDFTLREALDRQRDMERQMRLTRAEAKAQDMAGQGEEYAALKSRYRHQRAEYERFSGAMDLQPDWSRIYVDGLGRI